MGSLTSIVTKPAHILGRIMKARLILLLCLGYLVAVNAMPAEDDEEGEEEEEEGEEDEGDGEEKGCQNEDTKGEDYEGNVAKTVSGLECQKWSEQKPHKHKFSDLGEHNSCRNPDDYKGEVDKTVSGKECQDWAEQKPHKHKFEDVGEHSFCRNPDNHTAVWCYTTDKKKRWEACDVPKC